MIVIERINRTNYHLFEDMVYWRMTGAELTRPEKDTNGKKDFTEKFKDLEFPGFYSYGALYEGRFIGWISMMYTPKIGSRWSKGMIYVDELWVAPEYRNRGIAKQLMEKAYECQKNTGAVELRLYVGTENTIAQKVYKSCGFQENGNAIYYEILSNIDFLTPYRDTQLYKRENHARSVNFHLKSGIIHV
jgi:ribosomal protein S18 acetylase RimI-like enzyme